MQVDSSGAQATPELTPADEPAPSAGAPPPPPGAGPGEANHLEAFHPESLPTTGVWLFAKPDVPAVARKLEELPPAEYHQAIDQMAKSGQLGKYLGAMSPEEREAFVEQGTRKGYLQTVEPAKPERIFAGAPPSVPAMVNNDRALPDGIRTAVHAHNMGAMHQYSRDRDAYVARYQAEVAQAPNPMVVRMIGPPQLPHPLDEPGVVAGDPSYAALHADKPQILTDVAPAYQAVSRRMDQLVGRASPGEFWFSVEGKAELGNAVVKGSVEARQNGTVAHNAKAGVVAKVGPASLEGTVDLHGEKELEAKLKLGQLSITQTSEGRTKLGCDGGEGVGAVAEVGEKGGALGLSVKAELIPHLADVTLTGKGGVTGIERERAADIAQRGGIFEPIPELESRRGWETLPPERRAELTRDGWTAQFWGEALPFFSRGR